MHVIPASGIIKINLHIMLTNNLIYDFLYTCITWRDRQADGPTKTAVTIGGYVCMRSKHIEHVIMARGRIFFERGIFQS